MRGLRNQTRSHSGLALLPMRVSSGPTLPPTRLAAAFCTAWQDAQNDSPYRDVPAAGWAIFWLIGGALSPCNGVLLAIRKAEMSRTSSSFSLKFGMVAEAA